MKLTTQEFNDLLSRYEHQAGKKLDAQVRAALRLFYTDEREEYDEADCRKIKI